mmetsp:Transcript_41252/g.113471  ORF Transcript_41252/g.113471 Transcript_41252/m.113471 type:complete len:206 (-) Transcript_41252:1523-2140(-)
MEDEGRDVEAAAAVVAEGFVGRRVHRVGVVVGRRALRQHERASHHLLAAALAAAAAAPFAPSASASLPPTAVFRGRRLSREWGDAPFALEQAEGWRAPAYVGGAVVGGCVGVGPLANAVAAGEDVGGGDRVELREGGGHRGEISLKLLVEREHKADDDRVVGHALARLVGGLAKRSLQVVVEGARRRRAVEAGEVPRDRVLLLGG